MAELLDGRAAAKAVRIRLKKEVRRLREQHDVIPHTVFIQVGESPASTTYVSMKNRMAERIGCISSIERYPVEMSQQELLDRLAEIGADSAVHAVLVQLPLPDHMDEQQVIEHIPQDKDVDCFHPVNFGRMAVGLDGPRPATPQGVLMLLDHYGIDVEGRTAVVIGRSNLVGKPMGLLLLQRSATVTWCHSRTPDLAAATRQADIIVSAAGRSGILTGGIVKPGAVVVDVGTNYVDALDDSGKVLLDDNGQPKRIPVGDADFDSVNAVAGWISPVPGGVGPMTIISVLTNAVRLCRLQCGMDG